MEILLGAKLRVGKFTTVHDNNLWVSDVYFTTFADPFTKITLFPNTTIFTETVWDIQDCSYKDAVVFTKAYFFRQVYEHMHYKNFYVTDVQTKFPFGFSTHKNTWTRIMFAKLIEFFNFPSYSYTSSCNGQVLHPKIIEWLAKDSILMNNSLRNFLSSPVSLPNIKIHSTTKSQDLYGIQPFVHPKNLLGDLKNLFEETSVILITESCLGNHTIFTEKSVHPVCSLNFPIWPTGYQMVKHWRNLGFDVFDDILDNSYDSFNNMFDRCFSALSNNSKLLSDYDFAAETRNNSLDRLKSNRELLLSGKFYNDYVEDVKISNYPSDIKKFWLKFVHAK